MECETDGGRRTKLLSNEGIRISIKDSDGELISEITLSWLKDESRVMISTEDFVEMEERGEGSEVTPTSVEDLVDRADANQ